MRTQYLVIFWRQMWTVFPDKLQWNLMTETAFRFWCHFFGLKEQVFFFFFFFQHLFASCSLHHFDSSSVCPEMSQPQLHLHLPDYFPAASQGCTVLRAASLATLCQFYKLSCSNLRVLTASSSDLRRLEVSWTGCLFFRLLPASVPLAVSGSNLFGGPFWIGFTFSKRRPGCVNICNPWSEILILSGAHTRDFFPRIPVILQVQITYWFLTHPQVLSQLKA